MDTNQWFSARLQYPQHISDVDTAGFHQASDTVP